MTYTYQPERKQISSEEAAAILRSRFGDRVHAAAVNADDGIDTVESELRRLGVEVTPLRVDPAAYRAYLDRGEYAKRYPDYYRGNFAEKSFEHFVVELLGGLSPGRTFVDIASEHSPLGEIVSRIHGCTSYTQDIMYPPGIQGNRIGSDASALPVEPGAFDLAAATCSIEHFEGDADIRFMREMQRTLRPGGKVVVVPLYLFQRAACQTDPIYAVSGDVGFDDGAEVFCASGWGNRHGRFYSPATLHARLIAPNPELRFRVLRLQNPAEIDASIYCRFILEGTKTGATTCAECDQLRSELSRVRQQIATERAKADAVAASLLAAMPKPPPPKPLRYWAVDAVNDAVKKTLPWPQSLVRAAARKLRK